MSETMPTPEKQTAVTSASVWRRLCKTPLRDLIRGRLTGRLDLDAKITAANLASDAEATVRDVVKRTRLWKGEKIQVADELIAHFKDSEQADTKPADAVLDFGQPAATAKLIRRAKKRNRPLAWKALCVTRWICLGVALAYAALALIFYTGKPTVRVDYLAKLNETAVAIPPEDRSWPIYREAWSAHDLANLDLAPLYPKNIDGTTDFGRMMTPDDPGWKVSQVWLNERRELIEVSWAAADLPGFGPVFFTPNGFDKRDAQVIWGDLQAAEATRKAEALSGQTLTNITYYQVVSPHATLARKHARILAADLVRAAHAGDAERVMNHLAALRGLARQTATTPWRIAQHAAWSFLAIHHARADFILANHPALLSDEQLRSLSEGVAAFDPRARVQESLVGDQFAAYDFLQKAYTDDGGGRGRLTNEGVALISSLSAAGVRHAHDPYDRFDNDSPQHEYAWFFRGVGHAQAPLSLVKAHSRQQYHALADQLFDRIENSLNQPMHAVPYPDLGLDPELLAALECRATIPQYPRLGAILDLFLIRRHLERLEAMTDGLLLGIALERYRREHQAYPEALDQLTPQYIRALPIDRITGGPLLYHVNDEGPVVYSVGVDRDDDGGQPIYDPHTGEFRNDLAAIWSEEAYTGTSRDGDWVLYPQPAKRLR